MKGIVLFTHSVGLSGNSDVLFLLGILCISRGESPEVIVIPSLERAWSEMRVKNHHDCILVNSSINQSHEPGILEECLLNVARFS